MKNRKGRAKDQGLAFREVGPPAASGTAAHVQHGRPIPPQQQVLLFSPEVWELFIEEWIQAKKSDYHQVLRFAGAGDLGIDVAAFTTEKKLEGVWDNYQCKHYGSALTPSDAAVEVAKVLWHSFNGEYEAPRAYYFIAPRECGLALKKLLTSATKLRQYVNDHWDVQCAKEITKKQTVQLAGDFKEYVDQFDFTIFGQKSTLDILDEHRRTPYYAIRFGGGLPDRPKVLVPGYDPSEEQSRYVQQLLGVYSEQLGQDLAQLLELDQHNRLRRHFFAQREFFYNAEALRNFSRDTVPAGTFEDFQDELLAGVIDVEGMEHADGMTRLTAVTSAACSLQFTSNALLSVVKQQDKKGICHQLANDDRLTWRR